MKQFGGCLVSEAKTRSLGDWLPHGVAVPLELAERRAAICAVCPQNSENMFQHKGRLMNLFGEYAGPLVRRQLRERTQLGMSTTKDAKLGMCLVCRCSIALKVHVPLETIRRHSNADFDRKKQPSCWIVNEQ